MIQSSTQDIRPRLQGGVERFTRADIVMRFISLMPQTRIGLRRLIVPQSVVEEIISQDYGFDGASPLAVWPWADFGKVMGNELIAQNVALYPAKGAELKQS